MTVLVERMMGFGGRVWRLDRVWLALILLFAVLAVALPAQAVDSVSFVADAFLWIAPFLLLSVLLAAWLKAAGADRLIGAVVSRSPAMGILVAAAAGSLSPFCSCGVVPLVAGLLAAGVPLPVVAAFWLSSPLMDPEQFILLGATISLEFATVKLVTAFGLGLLAGFATLALQRAGAFADPLKGIATCGGCGSKSLTSTDGVRWAFWREKERWSAFSGEARDVTMFLAKWLLLAFAIESLMVAWMPPDLIASSLGADQGLLAIPLAAAIGVPAYLNGFAAIPLVGELMAMGMAPGAAVTFLVAGGATSIPAAMAVYALVRKTVFAWYLLLAFLGSLLAGFGYQALLSL
ncbi:permease [Pelagibius sp. Alg239-R121]|uniref:permease n=1 Tax=Pelagibius sp. Alg239-R121 TaxID=2993448 RepID=UPI0024A73244|nr:permease [Pelagibius sp. Alg239-R121]